MYSQYSFVHNHIEIKELEYIVVEKCPVHLAPLVSTELIITKFTKIH